MKKTTNKTTGLLRSNARVTFLFFFKNTVLKKIIILCLLLFSYLAKAQVAEQDSLALVSLYTATNGPNWTFNNFWLQPSMTVELWIGVETRNGRVVNIELPYNNLVGEIPPEIGNLDSLSILDLSGNSIYSLDAATGNLKTLDTLQLHGCPLSLLPPEIGGLSDLKYLNLEYCQISSFPDEIGNLAKLRYLYGANGMLQSLPETIGNMSSVEVIRLELNDISNLPAGIGNCTALKHLQLNANEIPAVPSEIGNLLNMEILILGGNNISELPDEMFDLTNLKVLNFAANDLDTIPALIGQLTNLENFQFFGNNFTYIPSEIGNCIYLNYINGYDNKIDSLPLSLLDLPMVETLFLAYNSLTFDDIEPLVSIWGFEYWLQDSIGQETDTTVMLDSAFYMEVQTGGEFNKYQWKKDGEVLEGEDNHYLNLIDITYADSGSYNCEITNTLATGLTLQSRQVKLHVKKYTAVDESKINKLFTVSVSPNPVRNSFMVDLSKPGAGEYEISIINSSGMVLKSYSGINFPAKIDISDLSSGIYLIQIKDVGNGGGDRCMEKIVKW